MTKYIVISKKYKNIFEIFDHFGEPRIIEEKYN